VTASALIVALERYDDLPGSGLGLPGSVRSGARFASWLLDQGLCEPERITLMTSYNPTAYDNGKNPGLAPDDELKRMRELGEGKVKEVPYEHTDRDIQAWMNDTYVSPHEDRGRPADEFFYLFWVGHGVTFTARKDHRICLLGADANRERLLHVELGQLLDAVCQTVPGVCAVGFVGACREPVAEGWQQRLALGSTAIAPPEWVNLNDLDDLPAAAFTQAYMCAASDGESTKMAGFGDQTFAEFVLAGLDGLDDGQNPAALFGDFLQGLVRRANERQKFPELVTFNYARAGDSEPSKEVPLQDGRLTQVEINNLLDVAYRIDQSAAKSELKHKALAQVCREAYCYAVGLQQVVNGAAANPLPDTIERLVRLLRDQPRPVISDKAPALVIACEYAASMAGSRLKDLDRWCDAWVAPAWGADPAVLRNRRECLANAKRARALSSRGATLAILVGDKRTESPGEDPPGHEASAGDRSYSLRGILWAAGSSASLPVPENRMVTGNTVTQAAQDLVGMVEALGVVRDMTTMLLEFVLPRELLGRRFEYEGDLALYPVAFRDLDLLRRPLLRGETLKSIERIDRHKSRSPWSGQVAWVSCEDLHDPEMPQKIRALVVDENTYALAFEHGTLHDPSNADNHWDAPRELADALNSGAAIVLSLTGVEECTRCLVRRNNRPAEHVERLDCEVPSSLRRERMKHILRKIDDKKTWKNGPRDLPFVFCALRSGPGSSEPVAPNAARNPAKTDLFDRKAVKIGVILEEKDRLWAGYQSLGTPAITTRDAPSE